MGDLEGEEIKDATEIHQVNLGLPGRTHIAINYLEYRDYLQANSLFMCQDENEDADKNQSFCSFLFVLKQTCDE